MKPSSCQPIGPVIDFKPSNSKENDARLSIELIALKNEVIGMSHHRHAPRHGDFHFHRSGAAAQNRLAGKNGSCKSCRRLLEKRRRRQWLLPQKRGEEHRSSEPFIRSMGVSRRSFKGARGGVFGDNWPPISRGASRSCDVRSRIIRVSRMLPGGIGTSRSNLRDVVGLVPRHFGRMDLPDASMRRRWQPWDAVSEFLSAEAGVHAHPAAPDPACQRSRESGVAGLNTRPSAVAVRSCGRYAPRLGWKLNDASAASSGMMASTGFTIRCVTFDGAAHHQADGRKVRCPSWRKECSTITASPRRAVGRMSALVVLRDNLKPVGNRRYRERHRNGEPLQHQMVRDLLADEQ